MWCQNLLFSKAYPFPRFVPTYVSMIEVTFLHLHGFVAVPNFQDELERCKLYAVGLRGVPLGVSDLSFGRVEMSSHDSSFGDSLKNYIEIKSQKLSKNTFCEKTFKRLLFNFRI